eukprot:8864870-Pyramimonas_sp.AAC.1
METQDMVAANTFTEKIERTYFGIYGNSRIDDLFVLRAMHEQAVTGRAHLRLGTRLQAIGGVSPRDHVPIVMVMKYEKHGVPLHANAQDSWDTDKMMASVRTGAGREKLLQKVRERCDGLNLV